MKISYRPLFFAISILIVLAACNSRNQQEQVSSNPEMPADSADNHNPTFTGRLYTGGLTETEAEKLNLKMPVFQLSGAVNYFFSGHDSLRAYIGRCFELKGAEEVWPPDSEMIDGQFTYGRGKLNFSLIVLQDGKKCAERQPSVENPVLNEGELKTFEGTVGRMDRPAPDIAYDYVLKPEKPFIDEQNAVEPGKHLKELPLFLMNPQDAEQLETAIAAGQQLKLRGAVVQGYAEGSVLQVSEVQ